MTQRRDPKPTPSAQEPRQKDEELALAQARIELAILRYEIEASKYLIPTPKQERVRL